MLEICRYMVLLCFAFLGYIMSSWYIHVMLLPIIIMVVSLEMG